MILLLPVLNTDEEGKAISKPYLIAYNLDMMNIISIEPDEEGRTDIFHKIGQTYKFAVPFTRFTDMLYQQNILSLYFDKEIDKCNPDIRKRFR